MGTLDIDQILGRSGDFFFQSRQYFPSPPFFVCLTAGDYCIAAAEGQKT